MVQQQVAQYEFNFQTFQNAICNQHGIGAFHVSFHIKNIVIKGEENNE